MVLRDNAAWSSLPAKSLLLAAGLVFLSAEALAADSANPPVDSVPQAQVQAADTTARMMERGETFLRLGAYADAAREFEHVIALDQHNIAASERLRRTYIDAQRTELLPALLVRLTDLYVDAKNTTMAGTRLDELVTLAPGHADRTRLEDRLGRLQKKYVSDDSHTAARWRSAFGIVVLLGIAWLWSTERRKVKLRLVFWGLALQVFFAVVILWTPLGRRFFDGFRWSVEKVLGFGNQGAEFLFGNLYRGIVADAQGGPLQLIDGSTGDLINIGLVFAMHVLPTIIFFGTLMSILYHLGILQKVVRAIAWVMTRTMGTSGAESLSAAGNIFVGQTEAPLLIRPYVADMTSSELMAVMTAGFATVAGGVLAAYVRFGLDAGHLLAASVMSAPAALVVAKIMVPETQVSRTAGGKVADPEIATSNVVDAAAAGATDGLHLALNVGAMLIAFISVIAMVNGALGLVGTSLKEIFGVIFYPLSWCMGVDTHDLIAFGHLLGTKISINEFVAYVDLGAMRAQISERTFVIATYALCGFANFASIGIQIGGISAIAPSRRSDLARLAPRAMVAGAIASWITACIAGILL